MFLKSFSILVPFDGVMTMAELQEVESPLNFVYRVTPFKPVTKTNSTPLKPKKMIRTMKVIAVGTNLD
jgi:hypothetical protein